MFVASMSAREPLAATGQTIDSGTDWWQMARVMQDETFARTTYEAELRAGQAIARIVRFELDRPTDRVFRRVDHYWLDLCLTPRPENLRAGYAERWGPHRFERLGEIFLVPPREALHIRCDAGPMQLSLVCEIPATAIDRWIAGGIEWTDRRLAGSLDITHPHMRSCLFRLASEARNPGVGSAVLAETIAGQLAIEVARYCEAIAERPVSGGIASWRLRRIDERLARLGPLPSLGELAELCALSVRQLTRGFRASRGCSLGQHIAQSRIDLAKRMLGANEPVGTISYALGYASSSSFAYAFRRSTGLTPRQFQQRQLRPRDT